MSPWRTTVWSPLNSTVSACKQHQTTRTPTQTNDDDNGREKLKIVLGAGHVTSESMIYIV